MTQWWLPLQPPFLFTSPSSLPSLSIRKVNLTFPSTKLGTGSCQGDLRSLVLEQECWQAARPLFGKERNTTDAGSLRPFGKSLMKACEKPGVWTSTPERKTKASQSQRNSEDSLRGLRQTRNAIGGLLFLLSSSNPSPKRPEQKIERKVYEKIPHLLPHVHAVHCRFKPRVPYTEQREEQGVEGRNFELNVRLKYHRGCIISLLTSVYSY